MSGTPEADSQQGESGDNTTTHTIESAALLSPFRAQKCVAKSSCKTYSGPRAAVFPRQERKERRPISCTLCFKRGIRTCPETEVPFRPIVFDGLAHLHTRRLHESRLRIRNELPKEFRAV